MNNIFDYLEWRGDLSFEKDGFNEVDNLIMSVLAYVEFEGIVPLSIDGGSVSLCYVAEQFKNLYSDISKISDHQLTQQAFELFMKAACTVRYRDIKLSYYVNQINYEQSKQFSAVVFSINNDQHFIAFRGTDATIVGWKEDFQMSFMDEVQGQQDAAAYAEKVMAHYDGDFWIGGHSKGGNFAVYAATHTSNEAKGKILGVYNNDGPGFQAKIIESEGYKSILNLIKTIIPKFAVVGMLLEHGEEFAVVNSNAIGIMQHNPFSWDVKGNHFVYEKGLTKSSVKLNRAVRSWLNNLSIEERAQFVDALFQILQAAGAKTLFELSKERSKTIDIMIKTFKNMDPVTKQVLKQTVESLLVESQKTFKPALKPNTKLLFSRKKR
ncbi:DUF2974 domain-containing protein [Clostridium peptidivorans]|uniref:DUF2974 domain-containing protein n=1 Tax=Clostridium peptidivorans TaxID=100174 RepID=UPI000BE225A1|nr:DUF2974 domain-containing protein [Clostridium peptidivorans]